MITIKYHDDVYIRVDADPGTKAELQEYFTFEVPGAKFIPAVKSGFWDGKIRLFNPLTGLLYAGLASEVEQFAADRELTVTKEIEAAPSVSDEKLNTFIERLKTPMETRDYQFAAVLEALNSGRRLFVSPTSSGKSYIQYLITMWMAANGLKTLIIVPTTTLVGQMYKDFVEYNNGTELPIHCITGGVAKDNKMPIVITTWQSVFKMPRAFFNAFGCIIGDEVHTFTAKSLTGLMEKATEVPYRFGLTGTLNGTKTHRLVLEGLFGPVKEVTTYEKLQDDEHIVKPVVKCIVLKHPEDARQRMKKADYQTEIDYIIQNENRNKVLVDLTKSLKGNILILFSKRAHGKILHEMMLEMLPDRDHFLVHGDIDTEDREQVRQLLEQTNCGVAVCSYKTFGTGINVKNLHHIIFASPTKSRVSLLQAIGRVLRLHSSKTKAYIWDVADDMRWKKTWINHTMRHLKERIGIYNEVGFDFTIVQKDLK